MLRLTDIWKSYGSFPALRGISLTIPESEVWALSGPNGAGKTSLIKIMAGLVPPDAGMLSWGSALAGGRPEEFKAQVHYVPQKAGLYPNLTVRETLQFFAQLRSAPNLESALERFDLLSLQDRFVRTLSGGQKQRVAVAQAFLGKGKYLLLDEPTANLDAQTAGRLKAEMRRFADQGGIVILSSHIKEDFAEGLIDHHVIMEDGAISRIT